MSQTTLNVRIDEGVKRRFDEFCADVGMNASVAVNLFVKTVVREQRIPFEITTDPDPFYSESNVRELKRRFDAIKAGTAKLEEHALIEVD